MYYLLPFLGGALISAMTASNGLLKDLSGLYSAAVINHFAGILCVIFVLVLRRKPVRLFPRGVPWHEYLGGVIGFATVITSSRAFGGASVSAMVALTLLGQIITSAIIDQFGLLGMPKRPFEKERLAGYAFVVIGILIMLFPFTGIDLFAVTLLLVGGMSLALSRAFNGKITERLGMMEATLYNFITGLATAVLCMLLFGRAEPFMTGASMPMGEVLLYAAILGLAGIGTVTIQNAAVHKVSAVYMALLIFVGQAFAGVIIDALLYGSIVWRSVAGGVCIAAGLALNGVLEQRRMQSIKD